MTPAIALAALALTVALPSLSSMRLYAAAPQRFVTVTVRPGDSLWSIAAVHLRPSANVQELVDRISATNHLRTDQLQPGERLRIPQ